MRFAYAINDDQTQPDIATGFIDADSVQDALRRLNDPRANLYPIDAAPIDWQADGFLGGWAHDADRDS